MFFDQKSPVHALPGPAGWEIQTPNKQTDIATYRLNRPCGPIQYK